MIVTRQSKGSPLNAEEHDNNLTAILSGTIGIGQSWQSKKAERSLNVTYTNNTGRPIQVSITHIANSGSSYAPNFKVDGLEIAKGAYVANTASQDNFSFLVPNGSTYGAFGITAIVDWSELR